MATTPTNITPGGTPIAVDPDTGALGVLEQGGMPLVDGFPVRVTTGASALLSASVTFPAGIFRLALVPHDYTIPVYMLKTEADNGDPIIPPGGISFVVSKEVADLLAVYSASANHLSVYICRS